MAALWKGIYSLAKSNVPQLMAIKEVSMGDLTQRRATSIRLPAIDFGVTARTATRQGPIECESALQDRPDVRRLDRGEEEMRFLEIGWMLVAMIGNI